MIDIISCTLSGLFIMATIILMCGLFWNDGFWNTKDPLAKVMMSLVLSLAWLLGFVMWFLGAANFLIYVARM